MSSKFFKKTKNKIYLTLDLFIINLFSIILASGTTLQEFFQTIANILSYPVIFLMSLLMAQDIYTANSFFIWCTFFILDLFYLYILSSIIIELFKGAKKPKKRKNARRPKRKKKVKKRQKRKKKV